MLVTAPVALSDQDTVFWTTLATVAAAVLIAALIDLAAMNRAYWSNELVGFWGVFAGILVTIDLLVLTAFCLAILGGLNIFGPYPDGTDPATRSGVLWWLLIGSIAITFVNPFVWAIAARKARNAQVS